MPPSDKLGELLVREKMISLQQLQKAQDEARKTGERAGEILVRDGHLPEQRYLEFLQKIHNTPAIDLKEQEIDPEIIKLIPKELAQKHCVCPINRAGGSIVVAMADPHNLNAIDDIKFLTGYAVEVILATEAAIKAAITKYYGGGNGTATDSAGEYGAIMDAFKEEGVEFVEGADDSENIGDMQKASEAAPIVRLVNAVLIDAIDKTASDIHTETYEKEFRIRLRIDGELYTVLKPPYKIRQAVVSRLKIMANLDIAERRIPQDGRIKIRLKDGREMDFRVSVLPCNYGEKVVMRLLDKGNLQLDMTKLGFEKEQLDQFRAAIEMPYGMVLVTGPTGSGKTTTLYSALSELNKSTVNIMTAEDPVEYNIEGLNQIQMHDEIGLTFASALRSFLRQDPNVILVGEIRDLETAEIAVKAALTGQLVVSTLHTNDAPSSITRLVNMGIEPFLVASSLNLIQAQRLVRKACVQCKKPVKVEVDEMVSLGMKREEAEKAQPMKGEGCEKCGGTGYKGRLGLYEILPITEDVRNAIVSGLSDIEIKHVAVQRGMKTLRQSALSKLAAGITTVEEVVGVTLADE
ncbi:MAG: type IV-A pilus assembly ATPase PilB [Deltaproteobacteria bacterium]|nr:type IV-A pilus assembly ATPase PilB [Deltaproteobacteria bacterium]